MFDSLGRMATAHFLARPIFIVGGSRSGTIALLKAMGMHSQILSTPSEDPFITDIGRMVHSLEYCDDTEKAYYIESLRVSHAYIYDVLRRLALESALGTHYGLKHLVKLSILIRMNIFKKRYWCTKTFPGKPTADGLIKLYPEAKFIWILRNGMNVVYSRCRFPAFRDLPFEEHCRHWASSIDRFSYLLDMPGVVVIHQEELADDPQRVFQRIFDTFDIRHESKPAEYALTHHVHPLAETSTITGVDIKKTLTERRPAYLDWSQEQRNTFKDICSDAMQRVGYQVEF